MSDTAKAASGGNRLIGPAVTETAHIVRISSTADVSISNERTMRNARTKRNSAINCA